MPNPQAATVTLKSGTLRLPLRQVQTEEVMPPPLGEAWSPPPLDTQVLTPPERGRIRFDRDLAQDRMTVEVVRNLGALHIADVDLELQALGSESYSIATNDPSEARSQTQRRAAFKRDDWNAIVVTTSTLTAAGNDWHFVATLDAYEGEVRLFSRNWNLLIPRSTADLSPTKEAASA
jgi:hypothetical protein